MEYIETKSKSGKSPKALGMLTGANFNLKRLNKAKRQAANHIIKGGQ